MWLIVEQSLAAGFIPINTWQQRASLPFKPSVLERNICFAMWLIVDHSLPAGFITINKRQQRASLPFKPSGDVLERKVYNNDDITFFSV